MPEQRVDHLKELKRRLDEWNDALNRLESEARKAQAEEWNRYEKRIKALREKEQAVKETLGKIFEDEDDTWDQMKQGITSAWSSLKDSLKEAKSEFDKGLKEGMEEKSGKDE
ncbi:MAG: hypothetical protein LJE96_01330 [Deltaproteobacteria bacterium]|jgi:DNA repair exonuclease SbcCD ATPase subunit|nr:hypothetical protein [Deltaproteobacteria bacterium]